MKRFLTEMRATVKKLSGSTAAEPPSVRKAYGFPISHLKALSEAQPQANRTSAGKAKPFRTEGGLAAKKDRKYSLSLLKWRDASHWSRDRAR